MTNAPARPVCAAGCGNQGRRRMDDGWVSACCPADFDHHAAILLSVTELLSCSPNTVVDVVRALIDRIPLVLAVGSEEQRRQAVVLLIDWGVPAHRVQFLFMPVGTWARDFAPCYVRRSDGPYASST